MITLLSELLKNINLDLKIWLENEHTVIIFSIQSYILNSNILLQILTVDTPRSMKTQLVTAADTFMLLPMRTCQPLNHPSCRPSVVVQFPPPPPRLLPRKASQPQWTPLYKTPMSVRISIKIFTTTPKNI